jgi:hypothetical protein
MIKATTAHWCVNPSPSTACFQFAVFLHAPIRCRSFIRSWSRRVRFNHVRSGELLVEYKGELTPWRSAFQRYQRSSLMFKNVQEGGSETCECHVIRLSRVTVSQSDPVDELIHEDDRDFVARSEAGR